MSSDCNVSLTFVALLGMMRAPDRSTNGTLGTSCRLGGVSDPLNILRMWSYVTGVLGCQPRLWDSRLVTNWHERLVAQLFLEFVD